MNDCPNTLSIVMKDLDDAVKNYHTSIDNVKKCKKSPEYLNFPEEDLCSNYFINKSKEELLAQSQLYNSLFKSCSLTKNS